MTGRYLIRLDDACSTMNVESWYYLESILDEFSVKPIVAVIPDNKDHELMICKHNPSFWERVRSWDKKGWTIAMHGYQHKFHVVDKKLSLLPYYDRSEFTGLSLKEQAEKIRKSISIFQNEGISPKVWVAPAHTFDHATLQALKEETTIDIISDGIALDMYYEQGFYWIPQQLWHYKEKNNGLWTICLHPNNMNIQEITSFRNLLANQHIRSRIISLSDISFDKRNREFKDDLYSLMFWTHRKLSGKVRHIFF